MRRPIQSLLIACCLIAMTFFLIGCEEVVADLEPQGEIRVEIIANEEAASYEIYWKNLDDPDAEEFSYKGTEGTSVDEANDTEPPPPDVDYEWLQENNYFVIQFVPFGNWQVRVIEITIGTEEQTDEETGDTYFDETQVEIVHDPVNVNSTDPVTFSFDFTTL
ncbi:hypothetical protein [uncultured Sphaerochaeta sp.]|uniref:hypothetical protein n=1 Tax=uncultured Sphaerochaeta sp. TaxID=886478 RepID=UPI002AA931CE|nr:hypothetical protein [uncultured Sphaerochaeta sp.]